MGSNKRRQQHLKKERERLARKRQPMQSGPGQRAEGICPSCGFHVVVDDAPIIRGIGTSATIGGPFTPLPPGEWTAGTTCDRCGAAVPFTNVATARMPGGGEAMFFASTPTERQQAIDLLGALQDMAADSFSGAEELAAFVEERAPFLQALADWIRAHQDALIAALIPTIATVLTTLVMQQDDSISKEDLEKILEHNSPPKVVVIHEDASEPDDGPSGKRKGDRPPQQGGGNRHQRERGSDESAPPQGQG